MMETLSFLLAPFLTLFGTSTVAQVPVLEPMIGASVSRLERTMIPEVDSRYYLGTTSPSVIAWAGGIFDQICLTADTCRTSWPTGGGGSGGGTWSTTTSQVSGQLVNYPNNTTDVVAIGANSTTTAEFWFDPNTSRSLIPFASSTAMTIVSAYLTNLFIGADTIAEYIADTSGAMFTGNTESGITVTYQDSDNTTDFTVAAGVANLTSSDFGDWTCNGSACTLDADSVALGTDTTGNYLATLSSSGSITVGGSGSETAAATVNLNLGNANTWTALQTFANASTTLFSSSYASSTAWYGGGLLADCDTAATSKLLWDTTTGRFSCGTDQNSGGGGSGNVATSTNETAGRLAYWTSNSATPALLGEVATTTLTGTSPLSFSQTVAKVGGSNSVLSWDFSVANSWTALQTFVTANITNYLGIGTTTPKWPLQIASSTAPQLALSDASLTSNHWTLRNINSNLYLATSSPSTFATSTRPIIHISSTGTTTISGVGAATSTQYIYSTGSGKGGSILLEDTDAAGCTEVYALNGVLSAQTVTCPTEL